MAKFYAGIGSRQTPDNILDLMFEIAKYLADSGWTLRSGAAAGADSAFEKGAFSVDGEMEIYLPWPGFNSHMPGWYDAPTPAAMELAAKFHPAWDRLSQGAKKLMARNCHQVLGRDLNTISRMVICWTPGGSGSGGTGQALRIAKHYQIPIFDLGRPSDLERILAKIS